LDLLDRYFGGELQMTHTPAGWHKDVNGTVRWWDGEKWTDQTWSDSPAPATGAASPTTVPSVGSGKKLALILIGVGAGVVLLAVAVVLLVLGFVSSSGDPVAGGQVSQTADAEAVAPGATDVPEEAAEAGRPNVPTQPESTFTPDPAKKYPEETEFEGIRRPTLDETRAAPKDADEAEFCRLFLASFDNSSDEWAASKKVWEQVELGTPASMPALAREGWEGSLGDRNFDWGNDASDAYDHYTFGCR
jgi:predicted lipid-binding transport protein (Tim44 family)